MTLVMLDEGRASQVVARVPEGEARREHPLRDLIYDNPSIMPVHELDPSYGRVFTVAKELAIPGVGFIDVLLADERGRLVVIECKLWRNPQARREVVGQILDYARELARYGYEDLQRQIAIATHRRGNTLYEMARAAGTDLDEARFVDRVTRDLAAGRFLLLIAGDGITEGTRRIGEYLRDQPGLAFEFGLVEMAEYQFTDAGGIDRVIMQPRVLAQTSVIERHVIRAEVPGLVIDTITAGPERAERSSATSDTGQAWRRFVERFASEARFDDPGQPPPRSGGNGWMKLPLPLGLYINLYRSLGDGQIGAQVRFSGAEAASAYTELAAERDAIDDEFIAGRLERPDWVEGEVPVIRLSSQSAAPWTDDGEGAQRAWFARAGNQLVNSLRPRLQRLG